MFKTLFSSKVRVKSTDPMFIEEMYSPPLLPQQDVELEDSYWEPKRMGTPRIFLDNKLALKVKIKSLAAEARIIRKEEKKARAGSYEQYCLNSHRLRVVRVEARATFLAYSFLRYRKLSQIEVRPLDPYDYFTKLAVKRAKEIVKKYGRNQSEDFEKWLEDGS